MYVIFYFKVLLEFFFICRTRFEIYVAISFSGLKNWKKPWKLRKTERKTVLQSGWNGLSEKPETPSAQFLPGERNVEIFHFR